MKFKNPFKTDEQPVTDTKNCEVTMVWWPNQNCYIIQAESIFGAVIHSRTIRCESKSGGIPNGHELYQHIEAFNAETRRMGYTIVIDVSAIQ